MIGGGAVFTLGLYNLFGLPARGSWSFNVLKKILIGTGVLLVVVLGGALIAPSFIDWNARLPDITRQVKSATGRDLAVDGRLELRVLPTPMLTARGVKLGNVPDGQAPYMATLDAVEVRVALMPLLSGEVQVERIRLVKPTFAIEKYADGRTNLEFQGGDGAPARVTEPQSVEAGTTGATAQPGGAGLGVRLDNFEIIDGTVVYHDVAAGTRETVEDITAQLRAASLEGPFDAQGEARVRGVPLAFEVSLSQIIAGRTIPINARINAPGGTVVEVSGAALELELAPRFKGKVKIEGRNLADLLKAATGDAGALGVLAHDFALEGAVNATASSGELSELELRLADTRATGALMADWDEGVDFNVDLKATRFDADAFLSTAGDGAARSANSQADKAGPDGTGNSAVAPAPPKNGAAGAGFALPQGVTGVVALSVDAVTFKGGLMRDVRLNAELADGELTLSQFQLQAPGVTDLALFGFVKPQDGQPRFNGDLEIFTADPSGLAAWLGVQVPEGVAGRVKRVSLKSKVSADQDQVTLSNLALTGDRTQVTGGVTVALRARPSFGADLSIDGLNLDTYMNGNGVNGAAPKATQKAAAQPQQPPADQSQVAQAMDLAATWAAVGALNDFDANLKVKMGNLTTGGRAVRNLTFDGTLYAGTLDLRALSVGDVAGAGAKLAGRFTGFGGVPEMTGVTLKSQVKDANAAAAAFGVAGLPKGFGAVTLDATAEGSLLKPSFTTQVSALGGTYTAAGRFSLLPIGFGYEGQVSAKHPDAAKMLGRLGYVPTGPLGDLDVSAALKTDGTSHDITDLKGHIGKTALAGLVRARTGGAKPHVVADLQTGALDIKAFLAKSDKRADAGSSRPKRTAARAAGRNPLLVLAAYDAPAPKRAPELAQAGATVDKRWSREAFDLTALNALDGELTLKSESIRFGDYQLDNADIHATLKGGVMTADRVAGLLFGGPVSGTAVVRASGAPTIQSTLKLDAMDVRRAVQVVAGKDLAAGKLGLNLDFAANGTSPADLVSSLAGAGDMSIAALDVKEGGTGTALAPVIGLVGAMNQFALPTAGKSKPKSGLADLNLSFDLQGGVADVKNLVLNSAFGSGTGAGKVDIAGWGIDFAGNMTVEPNLLTTLLSKGRVSTQEVPFSLTGRLDKPGVKLAVQPAGATTAAPGGVPSTPKGAVQELLQRALPGVIPAPRQQPQQQPQAQPAPQPAPQQQDGTIAPPPPQQNQAPSGSQQKKPLSPEEMIRQLMQGL